MDRVLLTNDDGINAPGIMAAYKSLKKDFQVIVVAPESEQSAVGHAISISNPLRVRKLNGNISGYAVQGTPADCVKIAVRALLKHKPDVIVSGINQGPNLAMDIIYSGTVSAATESAILGIPSVAVSLVSYQSKDFFVGAEFIRRFVKVVVKNKPPKGTIFNINVPAINKKMIKGVRITKQGKSRYVETFDKRTDPRGKIYYWLAGEMIEFEETQDDDTYAIKNGYISVTPIRFEVTNYQFIKEMERWNLK
ncbi:5'/3'-nucleotidase SurE [bacterium Unc6]|nr:5'/3'-nucleotidase SurE [bacterium Unc6]